MAGTTLAVILPIFVHIRNVSWGDSSLLGNLFPIFGLLAFTLLWLHAMCGVFWEWLCTRFSLKTMEAFVRWTALVIFFSIILHPLSLLVLIKFDIPGLFSHSPLPMYLGLFGLILLLTYDIGKLFKKYEFFTRNWTKILIISNIGFILIFFHSLQVGSDLQTGFMRGLWIFYGITAIIAIVYTYAFKKFIVRV